MKPCRISRKPWRNCRKCLNVTRCWGEMDFLLKVVATDIHAYERFLRHLLSLPAVREVNSKMVVSEIKCTNELPLHSLKDFSG